MWCDKIIRNIAAPSNDSDGREFDYLELEWSECRNVVKKLTTAGELICILLPPTQQLRNGDVIYEDAARIVVVHVLPCAIVVAEVSQAYQLAVLAMELGNLHLPAEVSAVEIAFVEDAAAMRVLELMNISWRREWRRFEPTKIISIPGVARSEIKLIRSKVD